MATFTKHRDRLIECPFDKNHKIAVRNLIKHIIDCEKKLNSKFSVCVYNASHRMPRHEFAEHIRVCPDARQHMRERENHSLIASTPDHEIKHSKQSSDPQIASNSQRFNETPKEWINGSEEEDNCDGEDWEADNCPNYCLFGSKPIDSPIDKVMENKTQKLTKNQKKRNRRKASNASKEITSIWD